MRSKGVANWAKESGKLGEGKWQIGHMQFDRGNKYEIWIGEKYCWKMPKMEVANWAKESGKLGEGRKAAPQPHLVNLC